MKHPVEGGLDEGLPILKRINAGCISISQMIDFYTMKVRLFASLREVAGAKEVEVDLEAGETVGHALERLTELHPNLKERIFDERGDLQSSIIILLKGRNIRLEEGLDTVLEEGDYLALFPPLAGGKGSI